MSTTSRRIAAATRKNKPSRTTSNRAKLYVAIPPENGWGPFTGSYSAMGMRNKGK